MTSKNYKLEHDKNDIMKNKKKSQNMCSMYNCLVEMINKYSTHIAIILQKIKQITT